MKSINKKLTAGISIGIAALMATVILPKGTLEVAASATPVEVTGVSNQNIAGGWGLGIAVEINPALNGAYWSAVTPTSGSVVLSDKFNASLPTSIEEVGQQLSINRGSGVNYYGSILTFSANLGFTLSTSSSYVTSAEKSFICKLADGVTGAYWSPFVAPTSLTLSETTKALEVGDTYTINPTLVTTDASPIICYRSSDETVATVSSDGLITAQGTGSAVVSVYSGLLKKDISLSVTATKKKTGITVTNDSKTITVYQGNNWKMTPLTASINYEDGSTSSLEITDDMISGTYDKDVLGKYTMTLTYQTFSDTFTIDVVSLPETTVAGEESNNQFGTDSWTNLFFFMSTLADRGQYVNLGADQLASVNDHVLIDGEKGHLTGVKNLGGSRYVFYGNVTPKAGDTIELLPGLKMFQYSGTANGNHEPNGDGEFYAVAEFKASKKYVYSGTAWQLYVGDPTDFTLTSPSPFISVGQAEKLAVTIVPEGTYGTAVFSSSDEQIATVSADGTVSGLKVGETTITAKIGTIEHSILLTVLEAKEIKGAAIVDAYNYYSVLKGSDPTLFKPSFSLAKLIFVDDTESPAFPIAASDYSVEPFSTTEAKDLVVGVAVKKDGVSYPATINVKVYETYDQEISEVAIVDWFIYSTFLEFKNTSTNIGNLTSSTDVPAFPTHISYTRKDGTPVAITGFYQLGSNIAVFPSFCYDDKGNTVLTADNYLQNYLVGDRITVQAGLPVYKWTGSVTGNNQNAPIQGTGEVIAEGYVQQTVSYRFNGQVWVLYVEATDISIANPVLDVKIGKTVLSGASRNPSNATSGTFSFSSSDPTIATVNEKTGAITGVKEGQATITVTLKDDDSGLSKTATITVNVIDYITGLAFETPLSVYQNDVIDLTKVAAGSASLVYASGKKVAIADMAGATIVGVDTSVLGEQTGVVSYSFEGTSYTGQLVVNVLAIPAEGMNPGVIAAIAGGSVVIAGLLGFGIFRLIRVRKNKKA